MYFKSCNFIWWTYCYSKMASNFVHSIFLTFNTSNNQMWSTYLGVLFLLPPCPIKEMGGFEFLKIQNYWMEGGYSSSYGGRVGGMSIGGNLSGKFSLQKISCNLFFSRKVTYHFKKMTCHFFFVSIIVT